MPVGMGMYYSHSLESCLITLSLKIEELKRKYTKFEEHKYKEEIIKYWLEASPHASWVELGRELLLYEFDAALLKVKEYIKASAGMIIHKDLLILYTGFECNFGKFHCNKQGL